VRANKKIVDALELPETAKDNNACKSYICSDRLHAALGEVKKANQVVRSFVITMEEARIKATRHILHLHALRQYLADIKQSALDLVDVENLYNESLVIENSDVEMQDENETSEPNTLTSQSLSFNGFSDSDSDYIP
jgi:hypothetical protein